MRKSVVLLILATGLVAFILVGRFSQAAKPPTPITIGSAPPPPALVVPESMAPDLEVPPSKIAQCQVRGGMQDPACTPGAVLDVTAKQVCVRGYSKSVRHVTAAAKRQVFAMYGIAHHSKGEYEVDHLISLELGGSNDLANLWPEAAKPGPGFHEKDKVENWLHREVCAGRMNLADAQHAIATSWRKVYATMPAKTRKARLDCGGGCP